ncbi:site-specific DNA methylase ['Chrysanthemum coronarium' phytoplasma]|uniref:Site-specific DNA-methyltransferase (adenine-specific) n=2 Tax='Chrysanthemum coronarium' phytoplasma TaxID=1520703 RepID=A0ABQ0J309_9MOLU|nr:site-specific DNA methylase ['Chrysanthemum coronarium' phytoplasma]
MIPQLLTKIPFNYNTYCEPFLGSGILFQTLKPKKTILNDNDINLIQLWQNALNEPILFCNNVINFEKQTNKANNQQLQKEKYKLLLNIFNKMNPRVGKSSIFYVLLKYAFRGVFKYQKNGKIYMSFGYQKSTKKPIIDLEELQIIKNNFTNSKLLNIDFESVINQSKSNDFIFVDPPYFQKDIKDKDFYQNPFTLYDHKRLNHALKHANNRNVKWLYTNYNSPEIIELFKDFNITTTKTTTSHNLKKSNFLEEIIISNY